MKKLSLFLALLCTNFVFAQQKNVVLFLVDDLGYYDLSLHNSSLYETPNIDQLARDGIDFRNAYVAHPRCLPSRYGLQTGRHPARAGIPAKNSNTIKGKKFYDNEKTIGQAFKEQGYKTFFAGKWHLGETEDEWPENKGYHKSIGSGAAGAPQTYFFPYNEPEDPNKLNDKALIPGLDEGEVGEYLTDRLTDETVKFIKNNRNEQPFFVMLSHYGVHTPFEGKPDYVKKYKEKVKGMTFEGPEYLDIDGATKTHQNNAAYAAMVQSIDESLGKIVETLKAKGVYENTIIVFTSDHGGLSNRAKKNTRTLATSNLPLRGGKGHCLEGGIKVPLVFGGARISSHSENYQVTTNTDLYPTLLSLCNLNLYPDEHLDGIDIKENIVTGETQKRRLFWHSSRARPNSTGDLNCSVIRDGNYKMYHYFDAGIYEVYNLKKDPEEAINIFDPQKERYIKMMRLLNEWKEEVDAS
ncbi:sulfatase [Flammeovirga sp. SubArs3]|uniref:sulfatase n=1 Tax=Flammeovirga sp. SubArs3 TaxID=2995316 RepID=UPI00248CB1E3|nr:sulfatase [Flammeovirga sp. SubArs3]